MTGPIILIYVGLGCLFALGFVVFGYKILDPEADGAGLPVRMMWMPGAVALWPLLVLKWVKAQRGCR